LIPFFEKKGIKKEKGRFKGKKEKREKKFLLKTSLFPFNHMSEASFKVVVFQDCLQHPAPSLAKRDGKKQAPTYATPPKKLHKV